MALILATQNTLHTLEVLKELGIDVPKPTVVTDSSVAIQITFQNSTGRSKHLDRKMAWLKETTKEKESVLLRHIKGGQNVSDLLTKYVSPKVMTNLWAKMLNSESVEFDKMQIEELIKN